jgi:hypothetical protein
MENNLNNTNDPIDQLKKAKPKTTSESRVEHLLQKGESRRNSRSRRTFSSRAKLALLATPALMALIAVPMFVANTSSQKLRLDLGEANGTATTYLGLGNWGSQADCGAVNRRCDDMGITAGVPVKWNYTFAPNLSNNSPDGHVYKLSNFGRELEIATMLTEEFNIDKPIVKTVEKISPLETETLYGAGALRDDKRVHVSILNTATYISVVDQAGKDWVRCQDTDSKRPKENCSDVAFENMPSQTDAAQFAQQFLQKLGIVSSIELADLQDNEFLIQVTETRSELSVSARLVLGGEPTASALYFHWFTGSNKVFMIEGILNRGEDMGLFKTLNSEQAIERLNGYITLPSVRKPFVLSKKSIDGMPWEEKQRLFDGKQGKANSTPVEIDVTVTKAVIGQVTIYDLKRNAWVVPGIHYFDETGHLGSVTSLDSDYIQMDEAVK